MALTSPNPRGVFIPQVPPKIESEATQQYLKALKVAIEWQFNMQFDNTENVLNEASDLSLAVTTLEVAVTTLQTDVSVLTTGTSGSFVDSDGNTVTVTTGLITALV